MRPDIWRDFKKRFNINRIGEFYGSTESPSALTNLQEGELGVGAIGKYGTLISAILYKMRFQIVKVDPDNDYSILRDPKTGFATATGVDEPGELLARITNPNNVAESYTGYYGNEKATNEKIVRNVFVRGDMYFRTGDLVRKDHNNFIYFVDRLGDTFRWKSENVSTNEVEDVITKFDNMKYVHQVVVVGVQVPQHEGRAGFAVIQPHDMTQLPDPTQLAEYLIKQLPRYAVPVFVKFVDHIPMTHNNKIQKSQFRNQKFPDLQDTIWWLYGNKYVPLKSEDWDLIRVGRVKL